MGDIMMDGDARHSDTEYREITASYPDLIPLLEQGDWQVRVSENVAAVLRVERDRYDAIIAYKGGLAIAIQGRCAPDASISPTTIEGPLAAVVATFRQPSD